MPPASQRLATDARSDRNPAVQRKNTILPRHHQAYIVLRQQVLEGHYGPEQPMPSEFELADLFNISRITIRRALERLESENLIVRRRGAGTFATPHHAAEPMRTNLSGLFENLHAMGLKTTVKLIEFAYITAPVDVARAMEIEPRTIVQKATRVRSHKGQPFSYLTTYVPEDIGSSYQQVDLAVKPLLQLLERAGVKVAGANQVITAKLADVIVAPLLQLEVGAPLLCVRRRVHDHKKRIVEYIEALYRPDLYEYHMALGRQTEKGESVWTTE